MGKDLFLVVIYDSKHVRCADIAAKLYLPCTLSEFEDALQKARIEDERKCKKDLIQVLYPGILSDKFGAPMDTGPAGDAVSERAGLAWSGHHLQGPAGRAV